MQRRLAAGIRARTAAVSAVLAVGVTAASGWVLAWFTTQILTSPEFFSGFDPPGASAGFAASTAASTAAGMVAAVLAGVLVVLARVAQRQLVVGDPHRRTFPVRARARTAYEQAPSPSDPDAPGVPRPRAPGRLPG